MIKIQKIFNIEDFKKLPKIQKSAWGFSDLDTEPHHLMTRVQKYGGLVQGLFIDNNLAGFTFAILGKYGGSIIIYSHMTAVKKEFQGLGYGFKLKKAQREEVLKMGYNVIIWNFDPIESLNSFFNIHRLGVICTEYEKNVYGDGDKGLFKGLPTDRLIAVWNLKSERVKKKIKENQPKIVEKVPAEFLDSFSKNTAYIEIPRDIRKIKEKSLNEASEWRIRTGELFEIAFRKNFVAQQIVFSEDDHRMFYKLIKREP
jgi:predicted GNAT superfamily acetyltransferase